MLIKFPKQIKLSHSKIKVWRRCHKQYDYKYRQNLTPIKKKTSLFVGSAIHNMIEEYLERGSYKKSYGSVVQTFNSLYQEDRTELGDIPTKLLRIVDGYINHYKNDGLTYNRFKLRKAEIPLRVNLGEFIFIGYIDAYPVDQNGKLWLMDHKSCKNIPTEEERFSDLQLLTYVWLMPKANLPKPDGVIWDYIRTKEPTEPELLKNGEISKNKSIDTTYEVYKSAVVNKLGKKAWKNYKEFADDNLINREKRFYQRVYLPTIPETVISVFVEDLIKSGIEIRDSNSKVRNMTKDCSWCSYYNLCQIEARGMDSSFVRKHEFTQKGKIYETEEEN